MVGCVCSSQTKRFHGRIAAAIYSAVSILNHSCDPNAALVTTESANGMPGGPHSLPAAVCSPTEAGGNVEVETARVVTLRNIVAGEEVTIAYRADWMALQVQYRREQLLNTWGFVQCARCKLDKPFAACRQRQRLAATKVPTSQMKERQRSSNGVTWTMRQQEASTKVVWQQCLALLLS